MDVINFCNNMITAGFNAAMKPLQPIPVYMTEVEKRFRSGLNADYLTATVINEMGKAGIDTSKLPNGQDNQICALAKIICEQIVLHIKDFSSVEAAIDAMGTMIISQGGNAGGPIVTQGTNYMPIRARGYVR